MTEDSKQKLFNFTVLCDNLRKKLIFGTTILHPLNLDGEKAKFFDSPTYNPVFVYRKFDAKKVDTLLKALREELNTLRIPHELRSYLNEYLKDLRLLEKTKLAIGSDDFAYYAKKLFKIHDFEIQAALNNLSKIDFPQHKDLILYNAYEIAEIFRNTLHNKYQLWDFQVMVDENNKHAIWTGSKSISIGRSIKRYSHNVRRLIVHEIESHALQRHNLSLYDNPFVRLVPYKEFNLYGEGLAVYNEIMTGTITKKAYNQYILRLKAVRMLDKSFREIYNFLREFVLEKQAFQITYRVKRGMKHTAKPGGFPKDAMYLLGYKTILDYIKAGLRPEFLYISRNPCLSSLLLSQNLLSSADITLPSFWKINYNYPVL